MKNELLAIDLSTATAYIAWARINIDMSAIQEISSCSISSETNNNQTPNNTKKKFITHSNTLIDTIETMRTSILGSYDNLHAIIINIGPGSFTGIRIALSFAQGLRSALNCKIIGLNAMHIWAEIYKDVRPLLTIHDARSKKLYCQIHECLSLSQKNPLSVIQDISPHQLLEIITQEYSNYNTIYYTGTAACLLHTYLQEHSLDHKLTQLSSDLLSSKDSYATYFLEIGFNKIFSETSDISYELAHNATPLYVRNAL